MCLHIYPCHYNKVYKSLANMEYKFNSIKKCLIDVLRTDSMTFSCESFDLLLSCVVSS